MSAHEIDPMVAAITRGVTFHEGVDVEQLGFHARLGMLVADPVLGTDETRFHGAMLVVGFRGGRLGNGSYGNTAQVPYYATRAAYPLPVNVLSLGVEGQHPQYTHDELEDRLALGDAHVGLGNHATAALRPNNPPEDLRAGLWAVAVSHRVRTDHFGPSGGEMLIGPADALGSRLAADALSRSASRTSELGRLSIFPEHTPPRRGLPVPLGAAVSYHDKHIAVPVIYMRELGTVDADFLKEQSRMSEQ